MKNIINWFTTEGKEFANSLSRDARSLKALWNWIYLALYAFLCVWAALHYAKECLNTAIVSTAGLVATIFTGYIYSKAVEQKFMAKKVIEEEKGESD